MLPTLCATRPPRCPPPHHLSLTPPTASIPCRIHLHITNLTHRLPPTPSLAHTAHLCRHLHGVHVHYRLHIQSPAPPTQPTAHCGCLRHRARARTDCAPCTQTTHLPRISLRTPRMHTRPTPPPPTARTAHVRALTALPHSDRPPPAHLVAHTTHAHTAYASASTPLTTCASSRPHHVRSPLPTVAVAHTAHAHALTALPHSDRPPPTHHAARATHAHAASASASTPPASRTHTR